MNNNNAPCYFLGSRGIGVFIMDFKENRHVINLHDITPSKHRNHDFTSIRIIEVGKENYKKLPESITQKFYFETLNDEYHSVFTKNDFGEYILMAYIDCIGGSREEELARSFGSKSHDAFKEYHDEYEDSCLNGESRSCHACTMWWERYYDRNSKIRSIYCIDPSKIENAEFEDIDITINKLNEKTFNFICNYYDLEEFGDGYLPLRDCSWLSDDSEEESVKPKSLFSFG